MIFNFCKVSALCSILLSLACLFILPCLAETTAELEELFSIPRTPNTRKVEAYDPLEKLNRKIFTMNRFLIRGLKSSANKNLFMRTTKKKAKVSKKSTESMRSVLFNIVDNLSEPSYIINHFLQGNPEIAVKEFWRFFINSTLGILGTFDIANTIGLKKSPTSYKQTFILHGVKNGPFLVVPLLGATSFRNSFAAMLEILTNPLNLIAPNKFVAFTLYNCAKIAREIEYYPIVFENNIDPYAKLRTLSTNYNGR